MSMTYDIAMNVKNEMPIGSVTLTIQVSICDAEAAERVLGGPDEEARVLEVTEQAEVERDRDASSASASASASLPVDRDAPAHGSTTVEPPSRKTNRQFHHA